MARFNFFGPVSNIYDDALFVPGGGDLSVAVDSPTRILAVNPSNSGEMELLGSGLSVGETGLQGTITQINLFVDGEVNLEITGISVDGATLGPAISELVASEGEELITDILDDGKFVLDARDAPVGKNLFADLFDKKVKVLATSFDDLIFGGDGNDKIFGRNGDDVVNGRSGSDDIYGGKGKDDLAGGKGKDEFFGGGGNDTYKGGGGADTFVFESGFGKDKIRDFDTSTNAEDIDLSEVKQIKNFKDLKNNHMSQDGNDVLIEQGNNVLTLVGIDLGDLSKGDFLF